MVGNQREKKKYMKKIMSKMFPNLLKTINPHIQEAQSILSTRNMKKATGRLTS